jgi:hypothetical protein
LKSTSSLSQHHDHGKEEVSTNPMGDCQACKHIQQEKQGHIETSYWLAWKTKKSISKNNQDDG